MSMKIVAAADILESTSFSEELSHYVEKPE